MRRIKYTAIYLQIAIAFFSLYFFSCGYTVMKMKEEKKQAQVQQRVLHKPSYIVTVPTSRGILKNVELSIEDSIALNIPPEIVYKDDLDLSEVTDSDGIECSIRLRINLDEKGNQIDIKVINFDAEVFVEQTIQSISKWKFKPAMKNNAPVPCVCILTVHFVYKENYVHNK